MKFVVDIFKEIQKNFPIEVNERKEVGDNFSKKVADFNGALH